MTREEAVKILQNEKNCVLTDCVRSECEHCDLVMETNEILDALDMAIKALEQPEIICCKDCTYGESDEIGRWYCRDLGCSFGEDGTGFCSDAERREE